MDEPRAIDAPRLLDNRSFVRLWSAQAVSAFGSKISRESLSYAAVLALGATPFQMGLLAFAGALPVLLFGLFAGVWVDRLPRRPILIAADLGRALLLSTIPVAALFGLITIWQLFLVIALTGLLSVFFDVADRSFLPTVVRRDQLVEANSRISMTGSVAEVGGPALAGALVQAAGAPLAVALDAISFIASALFLSTIRTVETRHTTAPAGEDGPVDTRNVWRELRAGLRVVFGNPVLRALALSGTTRTFFGYFFATLYVLYAVRDLGLPTGVLGLMIAAGGVGSLVGAAIAGRVARRFGIGPVLVGTSLLIVPLELLVPLSAGPFALIVVMMFTAQLFGDVCWEVYLINEVSLQQMVVPHAFLGRANATVQFLATGAGPVGGLVAGLLAEAIGARYTLLIAVAGMFVSIGWLIFSPLPRLKQAEVEEVPLE